MKYLLLKHYRGGRPALNDVPADQWTPAEWDAHIQYMRDMERRLIDSGEMVSSEGLSMDGFWVRYDGEGRPPVVDGPFAETKDLIAGWMLVDVDSEERALALASELSAAPAAGGRPLGEWLEMRPVMDAPPTITE
ncbi:MAG TPA: YciI family protein [Microbacterium sp.]|uniref:YciI family protein n=1 Tax=Microbacterium sp. TaxID=51671 RepID=UPI002B48B911|nr:YciI family protein [Microbacterium sp.]HKT58008.1 YciI family protein [Microbacterium sp.]